MSQVIYDPDPTDTIVPQDKEWVRDYYEFPDDDELPNNLGRWLLRIQMASKVMIDKKLTMKEIGEKIFMEFPNEELDCIWTDDNSDDLVLRIRIKQQPGAAGTDGLGGGGGGVGEEKEDDDINEAEDRFLQKLMVQCLAGITLRGITNISKVYMREEARTIYNPQLVSRYRGTKKKKRLLVFLVFIFSSCGFLQGRSTRIDALRVRLDG